MIKVTGLCCSKDGKHILNNINLNIERGSFVAIIGNNGSGKSTLVRHFNALIQTGKGSVCIDGLDASDNKNLYDIRQKVGMVFQNPESQSVASIVEDDIAFGPENLGLDEAETEKRIEAALSACGIELLRHRDISTLSSGQKQLVTIAGIIAMHPEYMVFDEATSMLDPHSAKAVLDCVMKAKNELGTSIIWITHNMAEAALADRIITLDNGEIISDTAPPSISTELKKICVHSAPDSAADAPDALKLNNVSFSYRFPEICVLDNISLSIPASKLTVITGKTGSGKSTLAEILCGITLPDKGTVTRYGTTVMQFRTPAFFEDTVFDEIAYAPRKQGKKDVDGIVNQTVKSLGIPEELLKASPFHLSGGQQRLVSLASVIASDPDIIILDEPNAGLDTNAKQNVCRVLQELKSLGKTVVVVTHSAADLQSADKIIRLENGSVCGGDCYAP